ncbi:hypothetical protein KKQ10_01040 [Pseudomonas sp. MG-9]|uniref:Secreted protein n=1 Tax=Pseudomonas serboccidentalis TaxID=2964670 RepID=A0ABY7ZDY4_9PSED|nr:MULTISPECIES: hypothetical protein [Pseudomonas]MBT9263450.1 hypothetical protein [Pseudomonas sp. MG-9]WDR37899.1 hypothetical protein NN484_09215 [Pseudomonas serboccidentalis]
MKTRWRFTLGGLLLAALSSAYAEQPLGCVEVTVGGYKAPNYDCLSQQMGNNPEGAAAAQKNQQALNVPVNKRPPNQVGLATPAGTSTRMGNTFGTSVKPQRPAN